MRRYSPLLAAFVLSSLLTQAGFATAGASPSRRLDAPAAPAPLPPALEHLIHAQPPDAALEQVLELDWPALIDERLAGLRPVKSNTEARSDRRLRTRIEATLAGLGADARVAVEVRDLDNGQLLYARDGERALNPASNQKLISAIAAVELLGPDYRFETTLWRQGDALLIRGEGDPDLHVADLHRLAAELARHGERFAGVRRILVDDSAFDGQLLGPGFRSDGPGDSYVAPSSALALDYGTVAITVAPGDYGQAVQVHLEPPSAAIEIHDRSHTGAGRLSVETHAGEQGRTIVEIDGAIPGGHAPITVRRRVTDPGLIAGTCLAQLLAQQLGSEALPVERGQLDPATAQLLATHESAPLISVLSSALRYSNNFTAEQVLRTLAWRASGEPGSWAQGVSVLERFAAAVSPEHAAEQRFANGSGLTLEGRASPRFIVDVLALTTRPGARSHALLASFAEAGGEGTLRHRLPHAGSHLLAKTGTYAGASTLSGIVQSDGRTLGFSILINGAPLEHARAGQDRIVAALLRTI